MTGTASFTDQSNRDAVAQITEPVWSISEIPERRNPALKRSAGEVAADARALAWASRRMAEFLASIDAASTGKTLSKPSLMPA
ncbi:hypothetical protein [Paracoccus sp. IB05]|uniref:hypothetical protein n=1 Tax=Paracoccus sp. IB05 TaxID=2779367 RepID=UPI0018E700C6|nr:hypothetical protein [Paracoccus sp. IB05]MBJ2150820.1 hypothetical protein [Paracoccus sp. IB05]